jgi:hypothetical protein
MKNPARRTALQWRSRQSAQNAAAKKSASTGTKVAIRPGYA